ncbi:MAG: relaxase domain-containing protein [Fimbriimonadaceae bacterium]|nr:relaxase domain-containing protein [Fimbriimonadaceae bacterium]
MLSIGAMSGDSGHYYMELARGDYYFEGGEPPGRWLGSGAEKLGLSGTVERDPFYFLLEGIAPDGSERLVRCDNNKIHHPGWDLTFSAPKSVGVIWSQADYELRRTIEDCQQEAVAKAVAYMEERVAVTRRGKGGTVREGADLVVATFEHGTSRAQDPQPHTHALFLNICVREDGTTGALAGQQFYRHKMAAGALYRAELAYQLHRRVGFAIERHGHCFEVKGVSKTLIQTFSTRRQEIEQVLQDRGLDSAKAAALAALETRSVKQHIARGDLLELWQEIGREHGFSRAEVMALVRGSQRVRDVKRAADEAADRALTTALAGQSHFTERDLLRYTAEECQWLCIGADAVREAVHKRIMAFDVRLIGELDHELLYTTQEVLKLEKELLANATKGRTSTRHVVKRSALDTVLNQHRKLDEEQVAALRHITAEAGDVKLINGLAGTGKTWLLAKAREVWVLGGYKVLGAAVAGKAAHGLQEGSGIDSMTVAGLRFRNDPEYAARVRREDPRRLRAIWRQLRYPGQPPPIELDRKTILVVDEASMLGTEDLSWMVAETRRTGAKLVLVGDTKQLPAIDAGGGFQAIEDELGSAKLVKIVRQKEAWARKAVKQMAEGQVEESLKAYADHGLVTVAPDRSRAVQDLLDSWNARAMRRPSKHLIFAATHYEVDLLNRAAQEERRAAGRLGVLKVRVNGYDIHTNDRVRFTENSTTFGVRRGMLGTVLLVEPLTGNLVVCLDNWRVVTIPLWRYNDVVLGYAMTTHAGQGTTAFNSYILMGGQMQDHEMAYVQMSRAQLDTRLFINEQEAGADQQDLLRQLKQSHAKKLATTLQREAAAPPPEPEPKAEQQKPEPQAEQQKPPEPEHEAGRGR